MIIILDTSVLCPLLRVPQRDEQHAEVVSTLKTLAPPAVQILLPAAVLIETSNHIAQCTGERYRLAQGLVALIEAARDPRDLSWSIVGMSEEDLGRLLADLPKHCAEGLGLTDASVIALFAAQHRRWPTRRVRVWSFDRHLQGYDSHPDG